jgi:hypothetical protein
MMVSGMDKPLDDALAVMAAWAADADEQSFLHRHVRSLYSDLQGVHREDALIDLITGLIILNGGLLKLQSDRTGVSLANIVNTLRLRTAADES